MDWSTIFSITTTLVCFVFALAFYYGLKISRTHYWKTKNVPSVSPFTFLSMFTGTFSGGRRKPFYEIDVEWCKKYGRVFGAYIGFSPTLLVSDPDHLRNIFVKDFHAFQDRRRFNTNNEMQKCFLTSLTGEDWKRVRSVVTPSFSTGKLKKMVHLMTDCAIPTTKHFLIAAEAGKPEECKRIFGGFSLDVIASTAFGTSLDSASDPDNYFVTQARKIFLNPFPWRFILTIFFPRFTNFFKIETFPPGVLRFFIDLTNTVIERRKRTKEVREDFLQLMIEAEKNNVTAGDDEQEKVEDEDMEDVAEDDGHAIFKQYQKNKRVSSNEFVAQCLLFFLAGHDTIATTISMTVYFLALNPKCQEELIKEIDAISEKYPELNYEALSEMKYMDAAINEALRMAPPATRAERKTMEDYPLGDTGITIPKDMFVTIPIYGMHYDPEFFPEPEEYQPERFLPENKDQIQPYTFLPFGAGPRNCLGMRFALLEIKVCLFHVFRAVTFERCSETKVPVEVNISSGIYQPKAVTLKVNKRNT